MAKKLWYKELLYSDRRKNMKKRRFKECDYRCNICGKKSDILILHHLTYKNVWNERKKELIVVCRKCHNKCHFNSKWKKIPICNLEKRYKYLLFKNKLWKRQLKKY